MNSFQRHVKRWMLACFNSEIAANIPERNYRFLEEALELVQANGCTKEDAYRLVDYVYDRPQGDINQEVGGVVVTLAALCNAKNIDFMIAGEEEMDRIDQPEVMLKIREKHAAKKIVGGPLP